MLLLLGLVRISIKYRLNEIKEMKVVGGIQQNKIMGVHLEKSVGEVSTGKNKGVESGRFWWSMECQRNTVLKREGIWRRKWKEG